MLYNNVYALKTTEDGKLTVDLSPFEVKGDNVKNVLICSPEEPISLDISNKVGYFIKDLPFDDSYKVVVDLNDSPEVSYYKHFKVDIIINAHEDPDGKFEKKLRNKFKIARYIGLDCLENSSYKEIICMVPKKNRSLERLLLKEAI